MTGANPVSKICLLLFYFTHERWTKVQTVNEFEINIIISQYDSLPCIYFMNWIL